MTHIQRFAGRSYDQLRPMHITRDAFGFADGAVLFSIGRTTVLCSVTLQNSVPPFLKGKKTGWLNAEYAMLPTATQQRTQRSSTLTHQNGRSVEISRLISRVLRTVVDLDAIGERTIVIDCDVLQADGSTRTAAITGASIALEKAQEVWLQNKSISTPFLKEHIAAVSVGILDEYCLLDLDFAEDSKIDADFNVILTKSGNIIEIQGTAERRPISRQQFDQMQQLASTGIQSIFSFIESNNQAVSCESMLKKKTHVPMFSLQNRLKVNEH